MKYTNKDFKWDFSGINPEYLYSEYKKVRIDIKGVYAFGTGYLVDSSAFKRELYPELAIAGYLVNFSRTYGVCDELRLVSKDSLRNNIRLNPEALFNVYMHPAEFTGYMKDSDVEEITEILKKNSFVKDVETLEDKITYADFATNRYESVFEQLQTDIEVEKAYDALEDVLFVENKDGDLVLAKPYEFTINEKIYSYEAGTPREPIWEDMFKLHSRGAEFTYNTIFPDFIPVKITLSSK